MVVSLCMIAYNEAEAIQGLFSDISLQDYPHEKTPTTALWTCGLSSAPSAIRRFHGTPR